MNDWADVGENIGNQSARLGMAAVLDGKRWSPNTAARSLLPIHVLPWLSGTVPTQWSSGVDGVDTHWLSVLQWSYGLDSGYLCFLVVSFQCGSEYQGMALLIYFYFILGHGCFTMAFIMALLSFGTRHRLSVLQWSSGLDSGYLCFLVVSFECGSVQRNGFAYIFLPHSRTLLFFSGIYYGTVGCLDFRQWLSVLVLNIKFSVCLSCAKYWLCLYFTAFKDMVGLQWLFLWHCFVSGLDSGYGLIDSGYSS